MNRTITVLLAILLAVGLLASISGSVAAAEDADTTVCTIEAPYEATDNAEASLCEPESPDDGPTILTVSDPENNRFFVVMGETNPTLELE